MHHRIARLALAALLTVICASILSAQDAGTTATAAGITFRTLPAAQLDTIKEKTGFRFGVEVAAVKAGTPAAAAGVNANDLVFAVGESGVDCAEQAAAEINALNGEITLTAATAADGTLKGIVYKFQKTAAAAQPEATAQPAANRASYAGIVFESLSSDDLDMLKEKTGYRLGVQVVEVKPGSPGAAAGLKVTDLVMAVGTVGVDSAAKAVEALKASAGKVDLATCTVEGGAYQAKVRQISLAAGAATTQPKGDEALVNKPTNDPIEAYFDMMDFIRTQAWNRKVSTSDDERQRVAATLAASGLDQQSQATLAQIPGAWAKLQKQWKGFSDQQKNKQRGEWQDQLLLPGGMYPPPANPQQFTAPGGLGVAFQYPGDWTGGWTEVNGTPLVFLGPAGQQAEWKQVLDTPNSPPGALFALLQVPANMQNMSYAQGAELLARELIPKGLEKLKIVKRLPIGDVGAVITYSGKFAGQTDEKFYWIGTKFGGGQVFAGRMGGSVKEAEKLVPAFTYMLQTLQLNPPQAAATGGVSGAWDAAWSRVSIGVVKNIWAPSGN
jgi:hypothetical protein